MIRGGKILASAAILAVAGCGEEGKLQIRSVSGSAVAAKRPVPVRIAEGYRYAALGNFGLALESFRKAVREDPNSAEAIAGMAACYDSIGRFDLSRRYYEQALALAPGDPILLGALAASLDMQGRGTEAAAVRNEIALRLASVAQAALPAPAAPTVHPVDVEPRGQSVTIAVPPPGPTQVAPAAQPEVRQVAVSPQVQSAVVSLAPPSPIAAKPAQVAVKADPTPAPPPVGRSVTVALAPRPEPKAVVTKEGPRLERTSLGEVALITAAGPRWKTHMADSAGPRFVPLREASFNRRPLRLLNAARVHRLAARTRLNLAGSGWSRVTIGDAAAVRPRSLIVYPARQREVAARLSAQTGIAMAERPGVRMVTVLLGRDATANPALRPRSS
jgi:LytR cell envelope-related transcriptional attenuator/Tetratricopeptide repeat